MADNEKLDIKKVEIADIHADELTEAEQEKVTGGGGAYGEDPSVGT